MLRTMLSRRSSELLSSSSSRFDSFNRVRQDSRCWLMGMEVGIAIRWISSFVPRMHRLQSLEDGLHRTSDSRGTISSSSSSLLSSEAPNDSYALGRYSRGHLHEEIGMNVSRKDKTKFLLNTLSELKDSKEAVYGALDGWVAWEQYFPIASLRKALITLEKDQQWHKVVQVIKWMLSKGQGTTMGTYTQFIRALEKDNRAEEAHMFWEKKIGHDLHAVPWPLCSLMIGIYYRNNMLQRLVKLFKNLEAFGRKPPLAVVQKVADTYQVLGKVEEHKRVLDNYKYLFDEPSEGHFKKSRKGPRKKTGEKARKVG